jgi:hypothetical protein
MFEKRASASTLARTNITQAKSYRKGDRRSSLKIEIGEILFCLLTGQQSKDDWLLFERMLRLRWQEVERC